MPGLLDFLNTDDGKLGIALLSAAGPSMQPMSFGQRLQGAMQSLDADKRAQLQTGLLQAQTDNYKSEVAQRAAALAKQQKLMDMFSGSPAPSSAVPAMPGQLGSGSFGAVQPPVGMPAIPQGPAQGQSRVGSLSPDQLVQAKMLGLDLTDVYKLTLPDMQVSNGYAYDKKTVKPGFLPQLNVSQNGQTSMVQVGPDGMPVISAPRGALDTYGAYRRADEGTKADYDTTTVTPQGQNPQLTTRGSLVRTLNQIDPKVQAARDADRKTILEQEVVKAQGELNTALSLGDQSRAARAQADLAALRREIGGKSPSIGLPLQSDEEKLRANEGVKADAKRNEEVAAQAQKSKDTLSNIRQARELLKQGPTSSGVGALVDAGAGLVGKSFKSGDVAAQLDTLSGWMVNNVPRMEGPQSNFDVKNYQTMAGMVGDRTKPLSQRLEALKTLEDLQAKYAHLNGGSNAVNAGGSSEPKAAANVLNELPKTAPKGQKVRDTATGKVLQFNGLSWVEVK